MLSLKEEKEETGDRQGAGLCGERKALLATANCAWSGGRQIP